MRRDDSRALDRTLLLAALRPDARPFASLIQAHAASLDWAWMIERATAHKVLPLLASRVLEAAVPGLVGAELLERLAAAGTAAQERNRQAAHTLRQSMACLSERNIPLLLVKGSVLSTCVYDEVSQRTFFDLDVVVPRPEVDRAEAALHSLGYQLWGVDRFLGTSPRDEGEARLAQAVVRRTMKRFYHELSLVSADRALLPIDLHWTLLPPGRAGVGAAHLWDYTTTTRVGDATVLTLDPEATVVHLAAHALSNRPWNFRLLHLVDFTWAAHRLELDFRRLHVVARRWQAEADLRRATELAWSALATKMPEGWPFELQPSPGGAALRRVATPEVLVDERAAPPPPGRWAQIRADLEWGWAMRTFESTAVLWLGRYLAVISFWLRSRMRRMRT